MKAQPDFGQPLPPEQTQVQEKNADINAKQFSLRSHRKFLLISGGFVICSFIFLTIAVIYRELRPSASFSGPDFQPAQEVKPTLAPASGLMPTPTPELIRVAQSETLLTAPVPWQTYEENSGTLILNKTGRITGGVYAGQEIIRASYTTNAGPCKGPGCRLPIILRFLYSQQTLTFLPRLSDISNPDTFIAGAFALLQENQWQIQIEPALILDALEKPATLSFQEIPFELKGEEIGLVNPTLLYQVFTDQQQGSVYSTQPEKSPQAPFYYAASGTYENDYAYETTTQWGGSGVESCFNEECYQTNAFFVFRPDESYLIYLPNVHLLNIGGESFNRNNRRDIDGSEIKLLDSTTLPGTFNWYTKSGCSTNEADYLSVVSPRVVSQADLTLIGHFPTGQSVYALSADHPYMKDFYQKFLDLKNEWHESAATVSYQEFISQYPCLFTEDILGRLIRLTNRLFVPPFMCEPIIYLYPEKIQAITIRLPDISLTASVPPYRNSWLVNADPAGRIFVSGREVPYLFWEGISGYWPTLETGFVVAKQDVRNFLEKTLPQLGLNENETADFIKAWAPELQAAPFYRISFYDQAVIDALVPLDVEPRPDTVIRLLMDYEPLGSPITLVEPILKPPPIRTGFTLVEWGGLKR